MRVWLVLVLTVGAAVPSARAAQTVATGVSQRVSRNPQKQLGHIYWVTQVGEWEATVVAIPGDAQTGDRYDLVDGRAYLGRVVAVRVEERACGDKRYQEVRARFLGPHAARGDVAPMVVAVSPVLRTPDRARLLDWTTVSPVPPPGRSPTLQAIDFDGDDVADLARYVHADCWMVGRRDLWRSLCIETWGRDAGRWRLIERTEFPPCE